MTIIDFNTYREKIKSKKTARYKAEEHLFTDDDIEAVAEDIWDYICEMMGNDGLLHPDSSPRPHHIYNTFFVTNAIFQTAFHHYLVTFGHKNINQLLLAIQQELKEVGQNVINASVDPDPA